MKIQDGAECGNIPNSDSSYLQVSRESVVQDSVPQTWRLCMGVCAHCTRGNYVLDNKQQDVPISKKVP